MIYFLVFFLNVFGTAEPRGNRAFQINELEKNLSNQSFKAV